MTRDTDLFKQFKNCSVGLTISTLNEKTQQDFEPAGSRPQKRVEALKKLHNAGIKTYVFIGPVLPGLTDIENILKNVQEYVDEVMIETINLKGAKGKRVEDSIAKNYPDLLPLYKQVRKDPTNYINKVKETAQKLEAKYKMQIQIQVFTHGK